MGRKKGVPWPAAEEAWRLYAERVGRTPRQQLAWALRQVETAPSKLTPADRENQRLEIAAFVARGMVPPLDRVGILTGERGKVDAPTDEDVKAVLNGFYAMLAAVKERREVPVGQFQVRRVVTWYDYPAYKVHRYKVHDKVMSGQSWELRARARLASVIEEAGHLLKECPAPAPRREAGDTCGTWFVASRPNQAYCSGTCQSRATTRAARTGTDTPVMAKRRAEAGAKAKRDRKR